MLATGSTTTAPNSAGAINAKASKKTMSSNLPYSLPPILPDEEALANGADLGAHFSRCLSLATNRPSGRGKPEKLSLQVKLKDRWHPPGEWGRERESQNAGMNLWRRGRQ